MVRERQHKVKQYVRNATCRLGDGQRRILHHRVQGSIRAVRAVVITRVILTEIRVVADVGSTLVFASLPHLQKVVNLGNSVQFPFLHLFLHFCVVFCVHGIQFWVSACQNPVIGSSKLPYNGFFAKGLACGCSLPPGNNISAKGKTGLHSDTMWYDSEYVAPHIGEKGVL